MVGLQTDRARPVPTSGIEAARKARVALWEACERANGPAWASEVEVEGWSRQRTLHYLDVLCAFAWAQRVGRGFIPTGWPDVEVE